MFDLVTEGTSQLCKQFTYLEREREGLKQTETDLRLLVNKKRNFNQMHRIKQLIHTQYSHTKYIHSCITRDTQSYWEGIHSHATQETLSHTGKRYIVMLHKRHFVILGRDTQSSSTEKKNTIKLEERHDHVASDSHTAREYTTMWNRSIQSRRRKVPHKG